MNWNWDTYSNIWILSYFINEANFNIFIENCIGNHIFNLIESALSISQISQQIIDNTLTPHKKNVIHQIDTAELIIAYNDYLVYIDKFNTKSNEINNSLKFKNTYNFNNILPNILIDKYVHDKENMHIFIFRDFENIIKYSIFSDDTEKHPLHKLVFDLVSLGNIKNNFNWRFIFDSEDISNVENIQEDKYEKADDKNSNLLLKIWNIYKGKGIKFKVDPPVFKEIYCYFNSFLNNEFANEVKSNASKNISNNNKKLSEYLTLLCQNMERHLITTVASKVLIAIPNMNKKIVDMNEFSLSIEEENQIKILVQYIKNSNQVNAVDQHNQIESQKCSSDITFDDIQGLDFEKKQIRNLLLLIKNRQHRIAFNNIGHACCSTIGVLLYGKPGTGKTLIAKSILTEFKSSDAFFTINIYSLLSNIVSDSEKYIKNVFLAAKSSSPSVIFIDEAQCILNNTSLNLKTRKKKIYTINKPVYGEKTNSSIITVLKNEIVKLKKTYVDFPVFILLSTNLPRLMSDEITNFGLIDFYLCISSPPRDVISSIIDRETNKIKELIEMANNTANTLQLSSDFTLKLKEYLRLKCDNIDTSTIANIKNIINKQKLKIVQLLNSGINQVNIEQYLLNQLY